MTDLRTLHSRLTDALEQGNIDRAMELGHQIVDDDRPVSELIDEFEAALLAGERAQARTIRRQIQRDLNDRQTADELLVKRASATLETDDPDGHERDEIEQMIQIAADTTRLRSGFLSLSRLYLARIDAVEDLGTLDGTGEALKDREETLETERERIQPTIAETTLPPRLEFIGGAKRPTVDIEDPAPLDVPVHNIGDEPTGSVTVTADSEGIAVRPEPTTLPAIEPGESETVELVLSEFEPGEYEVTVSATATDANEIVRSIAVTIDDLGSPNPLVSAFTGPDGTVRFDDVIRAIAHYNEGRTIPGSETKRIDFEEVLWLIEEYNRGE